MTGLTTDLRCADAEEQEEPPRSKLLSGNQQGDSWAQAAAEAGRKGGGIWRKAASLFRAVVRTASRLVWLGLGRHLHVDPQPVPSYNWTQLDHFSP